MKRTFVPFIIFSVGIAFTIACAAKPVEGVEEWPSTVYVYMVGVGVCIVPRTVIEDNEISLGHDHALPGT
jgi:hypothetical protein